MYCGREHGVTPTHHRCLGLCRVLWDEDSAATTLTLFENNMSEEHNNGRNDGAIDGQGARGRTR